MPGLGEHGRRSEFLRRCATALQALNPKAEADVAKLPGDEQVLIRRALAGDGPPYEGCFSEACLDKEPEWVLAVDMSKVGESGHPMSRCARCKIPKSFGRNWSGLHDVLKPHLERGKARRVTFHVM